MNTNQSTFDRPKNRAAIQRVNGGTDADFSSKYLSNNLSNH